VKKYIDPGNLIMSVHINGVCVPTTLIDLGAVINIMTAHIMKMLELTDLCPTPTVLESKNRSRIKMEGVMDNEIVSFELWEYPMDFMVLKIKSTDGGYHIILGRSWLANVNAFIGYKLGSMFISHGGDVKLYYLIPSCDVSHRIGGSPLI